MYYDLNFRKFSVSVLAALFLSQQTMLAPVFATDITNVTGNNGQYNINPEVVKGGMGFRHYKDFELSKGDIANLIYGSKYNKFVNLVDTRININGIVNTLGQDGSFYNGHAVFVSPMGMVIGSSGVLNVGSLTAIAPAPMDYLKFTGIYMGEGYLKTAADNLEIDYSAVTIPGVTDDVNLKLLKESQSVSTIDINGKIFARGNVELLAKNINVKVDNNSQAAIFAGIPKQYDEKIATLAQASNLFDNLVTSSIKSGNGFDRDGQGNIIIKAQSVQKAEIPSPAETLKIKGIMYGLDLLFDIVDGVYVIKENLPDDITTADVRAALDLAQSVYSPTDASDPNVINGDTLASVDISNAVLGGKNIDVNAVSKVQYTAEKGISLFDRIVNSAVDTEGNVIADIVLSKITSGTGSFDDFEGSRAKASVNIGENTQMVASNDVSLKALSFADTSIKVKSLFSPTMDNSSTGFYYLGAKTISDVIVGSGADIKAGNDINVISASKNSMNLKIKNPTSKADSAAGAIANAPSVQVSILKANIESDTKAEIQKGAKLKAGNDVNVVSSNVTSDQSVLNSVANILPPTGSTENAGIAVSLTLKDTNINTNTIVDGSIEAGNDANITAQNMHVSSTVSKAEVSEASFLQSKVMPKIASKITDILSSKLSGITEGLESIKSAGSVIPSTSAAVVVNDTNINTNVTVTNNASIKTGNDINLKANTVDLTVNNATTKVEIPASSGEGGNSQASTYKPAPGVSVIVNNQKNNTNVIVEDGTKDNHAVLNAAGDINASATLEQPMNQTTFELALNLIQTFTDTNDMFNEEADNLSKVFTLGNSDEEWDIRGLVQDFTNPAAEVMSDISNVMFGVKNSGLTNLGLQGFFNNWAQSTSTNPSGIGLAASVVVSDVLNNTTARIGNYTLASSNNTIINAANSVVQFNAAGDVAKIWGITKGVAGANGMGGSIIVEKVDSNAKAMIADNATITAKEDININAANNQNFLTVALTGGKSTTDKGFSITGSTVVQDVTGTTEASLGSSKVKAKNLTLNAGKAKIAKVPTALEQLEKDPFADLDSDKFEVGYEEDLSSPEIRKFTDTDINLGIDTKLGFADDDTTSTSTIVGSGKLKLNDEKDIKDGISNIMITGALAQQTQDGVTNAGTKGSSGVSVGASVNVSEFSRNVQTYIKDGAYVELAESLNVLSDSKTQSLNVAVAGAFAGGINMKKEPGFIDNKKTQLKNKADGYLTKLKGIFSKTEDLTSKGDSSPVDTGKLDEKGNPILSYQGKEYKTDLNGQYYSKDGTLLKDSQGNVVKANNSLNGKNDGVSIPDGSANKNNSGKNMSAALAGSVNVQINDSTVSSEIGNAEIIVGKDVNVKANQTTKSLNIGGGVAKASTVGAGAAVNVVQNSNNTNAKLNGSKIKFTDTKDNKLVVGAEENNDNIQVAIGVGVTANDPNSVNFAVSEGGSFNTDILENSVVASVENSTIENSNSKNTIDVDVNAENHSTSYKGAGGLNIATGKQTTNVGAGLGGNLNIINKTAKSSVDNSLIKNAKNVKVVSNKDKTKKTEDLISVGIGGSVITGGKASYTFDGALGTDIVNNNIIAEIINGSVISASENVSVEANNYFSNGNITGALGFSASAKGVGLGVGSILNILNNNITSTVSNSSITAKTVDVTSYNKEDLKFLAVNLGVQRNGSSIDVNGIVNVVKNKMIASVVDSQIVSTGDVNVSSLYDTKVSGITGVGAISAGKGISVGANVLSNSLLSENLAYVSGSDIDSKGKLTVNATSNDDIDIVPVAAAITSSGQAAAAANVGVNVVSNTTKAYIDKSENNNSKIKANGIDVSATDYTTTVSRGGTIAVAAAGTVSVGGSISVDVITKNVQSYIDNALIQDDGAISVNAESKNIFGAENPGAITASSLASDITNGEYDASVDARFDKWNMSYDVAGSKSAAISGTVITKTVANDVNSYIGSNTTIANADSINVSALNKTSASAIIGNVSVGGQAAVGASLYTNVNASNVNAGIKSGAKIGTESKVGDVTISADSIQDYRSINFAVGASSSAAVTGSINTNIVVNETNAYIENGTDINSNGKLTVNASDSMDAQNFQLAVAGASGAAVGVISDINVLNNKVNSIVGKTNSDDNTRKGKLSFGNNADISALSEQNYQANVLMVAGSGSAAVGGVVISNTMASDVNSGIENTTLISENGKINVNAESSFNKKHKNQTTGIGKLLKDDKSLKKTSLTAEDLEESDMIPLVSILNVAASGGVVVSGTVVNNNVITTVNSYVKNADVTSASGLNVNANSSMTTYDAVMGVTGAGAVAVSATGVVNTYAGSTNSEISDSKIKGSTKVNAANDFSLNTIIFSASGSGTVSVSPVINSNTLSNSVIAQITNTEITNAATVDVISSNDLSINDIILAGSVAGTGAAVNAVPITNVFVGETSSYIKNSSIDGAKTNVNAFNDIDTISLVLGIAGAGIGADVSGYVLTNVFDNDLNAKIEGSTFTNAKQTNTSADSNLSMIGDIVSGGVTGLGASVVLNAITNVVKNNINSGIADSSITGGSVSVAGTQNSYVYNNTSAINATGVGNSSAANSVTNVFTNNINALLADTDIVNASTVSVLANSMQDITNVNVGVSVSGIASNSANSIVNVLENTTNAKVSAGNKNIKSSGKLSVKSNDTLKMSNSMGMLTAGGYEAAGANINVNVINNAIKAELLSNTAGLVTANNVEVTSDSTIALEELMTGASAGIAGISGNVIVNSIGSKFADDDTNLKDAKLSNTLAKTDDNYKNTSSSVSYSKNRESKTIDEAYSLTKGTNKEGTVANINANVTATGTTSSSDKSAIKVSATNVVKGYNSDTFSLTNATGVEGIFAAGASVLVNKMKYNTIASIDGGNLTAEKGDVNVIADSTVKAKIDTVEASVGAVSIGGNVGYFNNKSNTTAQISNATINAKNVGVKANSLDNIALNIISATAGKISANLSLALNTTSNTVNSYITGSDVYITADTVDVIATNTSTLKSQLDSLSVGKGTFGLVINKSESNAITRAIANATGNITTGGLNFIAQSDGITAETTMNLGNIAGLSLSYAEQGAFVNSEFKAGIDSENLVVKNSGKTNILSGVDKSSNSAAAEMKAKVVAKKASATLAEGSLTSLNAGVNAKTEAILKAKHSSDSLDISSKLKRTADVGSSVGSLGAISISGLNMKSSTSGTNNVTIGGDNFIKNAAAISLTDESNANTSMLDASLSLLVGTNINNSIADIDTDTNVTLGGKFNANDITVKQTVNRNSSNTAESKGGGLAKVDIYKLQTSSKGNSQVDILADMTDDNYRNALTVNSIATNNAQSILSSNTVALAAISQETSSNTLSAKNKINLQNAKIKSKSNINLNALSNNKATMKKDAQGSGAVIVLGGELNNNITSGADIVLDNSTVSAKNINLSAAADLGTVDNKEIEYKIGISGASVTDKTYISNDVSQTSNINVKNSELSATDSLNSKVKTTSEFKQKIKSDGNGFVAKNVATSKLSVTNNNNFTVDKNSKLYANKVDVAMDSSNRLDSKVDIKVGHFGGLNPDGTSEINLTVNNKLDNKGSIKAGELAQIDLMKNSKNILNQDTSVVVEASIATADAAGSINYTVNNDVKIAKGADISSGKDVIMNYSNGNNTLNSRIYSKKTSRLLFGIPIVKKKQYSSVTQNTNNSLALDGEVVAGSSSKRYMKINRDGTIDTSTIQGFVDGEYKIVDAVSKSGEELTAETIDALNDKINELKEKVNELQEYSADYQADLDAYNAQITELTNLYNDVKSRSSITPDEVANSMKSNIKNNVVLGSDETNDSKISEDIFNRIYEGADGLETDFKAYLDNFVVKEAEGDNPEVKLSENQKTLIMNSYNTEIGKIQDVGGGAYSVYDGKVIATAEEFNTIKNELNSSIGSLANAKNDLQSSINNINSNISTINSNINSYNDQITYLNEHPLSDVNIAHSSIEFDNLIVLPSKIELNGIRNTDISGKGNFKTYMPNLVIDNYSSRNLVFKNIDLMTTGSAGLNINGRNYSSYANTLKQVNHANSFADTPDTVIGSTVHFISDNDASKSNNVTITNYFDSLNPALSLAEAITSDITFGGYISAANKLDVLNESGDIFFNNFINTGSKDIIATQGNIVYNAGGSDFELKVGDRMLAGKDVTITAKNITLDGTLQAGYEDKNIIITDDMVNNLVVDPTTGERNMVNLGTTDKSAYLENTNNIKVLYKDGKLLVFNTKQEGGNVKLTGNVKGQGTVKYTNGYADVTITNNTNKELVINTLENNRMDGEFTNRGTVANVVKQGKDKATTSVSSNGKVNVIGAILNGKGKTDADLVSDLNISSNNGIEVASKVNETGLNVPAIDSVGNVNFNNTGSGVIVNGIINNSQGDVSITNNGTSIEIINSINNETGNTTITNNGTDRTLISGTVSSKDGLLTIENNAENGIEISGLVENENGNILIANSKGDLNITKTGKVELNKNNTSLTNDITVSNTGTSKKQTILGWIKNFGKGNTKLENKGTDVTEIAGTVENTDGTLEIAKSGTNGILVSGSVANKKGNTNITNESQNGGIKLATSGTIKNDDGNINISNTGTQGIIVEGIINTVNKDIGITNKNSDLIIGEYDSGNDNYIKADNGNVIINQINGNILNGITDIDSSANQNHDRGNVDKSYKTLISSSGNLTLDVKDGNIGSDSHSLANKESGFGINASTRDYTESLNVNVKGKIKAKAENNGNALINIRAKESDLNIDGINSDGNVMLTDADWKQADENPARTDSEYLTGYSINNSSTDNITPNITGRNISLISSNNVGDKNKSLTYNQTENGSISVLAENDVNISGKGNQDNIWQLISKNGNINLDLNGDASIREITAAKNLKLISKGHNLTIYDLGKISNAMSVDDILFPHDGIDISGIVPETIEIQVLDTNSETQDSNKGNSTLNIFNAYVKGNDSKNPDVILKADNIIAHAYDAPSSTISNTNRPNGFDAKDGRTYANDYTDETAEKDLKATGFNTVGEGGMLSFEISGVSPDDVAKAGSSNDLRNYNSQKPIDSSKEFKNPNGFKGTVYKAGDVTLSLNSSNDNAPTDNRGLQIDKIYTDNAYVDTKDLNLNVTDGFITNYGEFRNGNRGGSTGGNYISDDYRWSAIIDNDFNRNLINLFPKTATTLQMFTKKTGSFGLSLGNVIASNTKAPVVVYDPNNNIIIPRTENSFYRLTYKDNKIQVNTTEVDYEEFEEAQLHPKREFIRFGVVDNNDGFVKVVDKKYPDKNRIVSLENISRGGLLVVHDGTMKEKEKFFVDITYGDINVITEVEVTRLAAGNKAGLKFINLDKATANKILYMNMALEENATPKVKVSNQK